MNKAFSSCIDALLGWPERVAQHLLWLGPLFAHVQSMNNWNDLTNMVPQVKAATKKAK